MPADERRQLNLLKPSLTMVTPGNPQESDELTKIVARLEALTGIKQMDATAILDYFAPLSKWLDEQLAGKQVGW